MDKWSTGHDTNGERVLIKFKSGDIRIAKWIGTIGEPLDVCVYNSWQTDEGYWYPEALIMGWMPLPK